jgi:peptide-methionine (S)-S-oxide reductase
MFARSFGPIIVALLAALLGISTARAATEASPPAPEGLAKATFAGGCFWCMEQPFEALPGVKSAVSGYTGGSKANPAYRQVSGGSTGHAEAVEVLYDPKVVGYERLLEVFWANIDPTVKDRQFCDAGSQYRSAIFTLGETQRQAAEASKAALERSGRFARIHTDLVPAGTFHPAEEYHQDYYRKNPIRYKVYRTSCGRDARLAEVWRDKR